MAVNFRKLTYNSIKLWDLREVCHTFTFMRANLKIPQDGDTLCVLSLISRYKNTDDEKEIMYTQDYLHTVSDKCNN